MAFASYHTALHDFSAFLRDDIWKLGGLAATHAPLREALEKVETGLGQTEGHLAAACEDERITLQLCLACWERDWNHNGRLDRADRLLFQIELDAHGQRLPEGDPRRTPTFTFDLGDVYWARAMVSFQRAVVNLVLAYRWRELDQLFVSRQPVVTIVLEDRPRVLEVRELLVAGLAHADQARRLYLAETDDQGEWVPNPKQKNHPLPLPVDQALYDTWKGVVGDLQRLLAGKEGLGVSEIAQLGDHTWEDPPRGFIDLKRLTTEPADIILNRAHLLGLGRHRGDRRTRHDVEAVLRDVFGDKYVESMRPSPLVKRLVRMKGEIDRGEESLERKLRYLLWLN